MTEPTIVEVHPIGPCEPSSRSIIRRDGGRVELRLTPIADCATCSKSIPAVACACCGDGFLARLAIAHDVGGVLLCLACLGRTCGHAAAPDEPILRLVSLMERDATN